MTDKDILISTLESHVLDIGSQFFNLGVAGQLATRVVIRNLADKYSDIIDLFITKDGDLVGEDAIFNAAVEMLDARPEKGFVIWKVKITSDDVKAIQEAFKKSKLRQQ